MSKVIGPTDKLSPQEKILRVLRIIDDQIQISPTGELLRIHDSKFASMSDDDVSTIFKKLEKDYKLIKIHSYPNGAAEQHWVLEKFPNFTQIYEQQKDEFGDSAIANLSQEAVSKIWPVLNALSLQMELLGNNYFDFPDDKFERNKVHYGDLGPVLTRLHTQGLIEVNQVTWSKRTHPEQPIGGVMVAITEDPDIIHGPGVKIRIFEEKFMPFYKKLQRRVGKLSIEPENKPQALSILKEIKRLVGITPEKEAIVYQLLSPPGPVLIEEKTFLRKLEQQGVIKKIQNIDDLTSAHTIEVDQNLLESALATLVQPDDRKPGSHTVTWPNSWGWSEDEKTYKTDDREISFSNTDSDTYKVFRVLVDAKGDSVKTKEIESKTGAKNVQVTISNLNNDKLAKSPVVIIPLKGKISAYKAHARQFNP